MQPGGKHPFMGDLPQWPGRGRDNGTGARSERQCLRDRHDEFSQLPRHYAPSGRSWGGKRVPDQIQFRRRSAFVGGLRWRIQRHTVRRCRLTSVGNAYVVGWTDSPFFSRHPRSFRHAIPPERLRQLRGEVPYRRLARVRYVSRCRVAVCGRGRCQRKRGHRRQRLHPRRNSSSRQGAVAFWLTLNSTGSSIGNFAYIGGDTTQGVTRRPADRCAFSWPLCAGRGRRRQHLCRVALRPRPTFRLLAAATFLHSRSVTCNAGPSFARSVPPADGYS